MINRGDEYDFSAAHGGDAAGEAARCCEADDVGVQRSSGMWSFGQSVEVEDDKNIYRVCNKSIRR